MSQAPASPGEPFDLEKLRELIELMERHGLTEINLRKGDQRWQLRRGPTEPPMMVGPPYAYAAPMPFSPPPAPSSAPVGPPAAAPQGAGSGAVPAAAGEASYIKSPTVGTFYSANAPGDEPFVRAGSKVTPETTVCIIEAMKVFNQIPAETTGTILEVLAKNGDAVEYGQPLFRIQPG